MLCSECEVKKDSLKIRLISLKSALTEAAEKLRGSDCRIFMAKTVSAPGKGGQRIAEEVPGRNRKTIRKGQYEIGNGIRKDNFSGRGRRKAEEKLPDLLRDIRETVGPASQTYPTSGTVRIYSSVTASSVRECPVREKGYTDAGLPTVRTVSNKLNMSGYCPRKVAKVKPRKK